MFLIFSASLTLTLLMTISNVQLQQSPINDSSKMSHEQFTQKVGNTSVLELLALSTLPSLLICVRNYLLLFFHLNARNIHISLISDVLCILLPTISLLTFGNLYIFTSWTVLGLIYLSLGLLTYYQSFNIEQKSPIPLIVKLDSVFSRELRAVCMLLTCLMILCIDLPICPRRFAKTHTYGFSLMDTGTGWAIVISALSGARTLLQFRPVENLFRLAYRAVLPLFILGIIRICAVSLLDYPQPPTEYGLHWNFFFTIAFVRLLSVLLTATLTIAERLFNSPKRMRFTCVFSFSVVALALSAFCENMVKRHLLDDAWPSTDERLRSVLVANVEGLFSLPGYAAIYFFALFNFMVMKHLLTPRTKNRMSYSFSVCVLYHCTTTVAYGFYLELMGWETISRRFATPSYVVFILFLCNCTMFVMTIPHWLHPFYTATPSALTHILSSYAAVYFVLSNILTGVVNILVDTLRFLPHDSFVDQDTGVYPTEFWLCFIQLFILLIYVIVCLSGVFLFDHKQIQLDLAW
ncbi:phosphatidylinositol glycan, class W [Paragonimus westermani]|uniref:Phosphatidylinositol-glycan biosynthesis class W protein n=1 Tax=Paragonimus westermani TaxID=34504 RepID=A0A5J4N5M7_9TREM|nr:phosphatidylinositol glycan, class W [Paragonimus westermani]